MPQKKKKKEKEKSGNARVASVKSWTKDARSWKHFSSFAHDQNNILSTSSVREGKNRRNIKFQNSNFSTTKPIYQPSLDDKQKTNRTILLHASIHLSNDDHQEYCRKFSTIQFFLFSFLIDKSSSSYWHRNGKWKLENKSISRAWRSIRSVHHRKGTIKRNARSFVFL